VITLSYNCVAERLLSSVLGIGHESPFYVADIALDKLFVLSIKLITIIKGAVDALTR